MNCDLTRGPVTKSMLLFAIPMILGDLLQQCYNIADTLIVGQFLGRDALAAVGSSFTLMTFLTSIILGLCIVFLYRARHRALKHLIICLPGRASHLPPGSRRGLGRYA